MRRLRRRLHQLPREYFIAFALEGPHQLRTTPIYVRLVGVVPCPRGTSRQSSLGRKWGPFPPSLEKYKKQARTSEEERPRHA